MSDPVFFVAVYFMVILFFGFFSALKIKSSADYYIAGKKASLFPVTSSLLATILGGSAILGTIELSQNTGWPALWFLLCASFGLFMLTPLARYVSRYGKYTLPGLIGRFYGSKARFMSSLIIPLAWLGIIAAQIIAAAKILTSLGVINYQWSALFAGLVFTFYTVAGGQLSILKTDMIQAFLIVSGLVALTVFALLSPDAGEQVPLNSKALFNEYFSPADLLILVLTYSVTFVVGPDIYSRIFCAKDEKTATRSVLIAAFLLIPVSFMLTFLGIFSGYSGSSEILLFAGKLLPSWFYGLFLAALLSAVMSSADTTLMNSSLILSELVYSNSDDKRSVAVTRLFITVMGVLSITVALFITSIMQSLLISLSFFSGAFVIPVLAGLMNVRTCKNQVMAAMICGGIIALTGKLINLFADALAGNIIIILAFVVNSFLLFIPLKNMIYKH
jgi:SSS family solute:Na+ symporter